MRSNAARVPLRANGAIEGGGAKTAIVGAAHNPLANFL